MRFILGAAASVAGVALLIAGTADAGSLSSGMTAFFIGTPSDRAIWLTTGGVGCVLLGLALAMVPRELVKR